MRRFFLFMLSAVALGCAGRAAAPPAPAEPPPRGPDADAAVLDAGVEPLVADAAPVPPPKVMGRGDAGPILTYESMYGDYYFRAENYAKAISSDGKRGAAVEFDGRIAVWDLTTLQRAAFLPSHDNGHFSALAFTQDGQRLASAFLGNRGGDVVELWDISSATLLWSSSEEADRLQFSPDDMRLVGGRLDVPRVWSVSDGQVIWSGRSQTSANRSDERGSFATLDGRKGIDVLVSAWTRHTGGHYNPQVPAAYALQIVDLDDPKSPTTLALKVDAANGSAGISETGDRIALRGWKELHIVDTATGKLLGDIPVRDVRTAFLPAGSPYVITNDDKELTGWDIASGTKLWSESIVMDGVTTPRILGKVLDKDAILITDGLRGKCSVRSFADGSIRWERNPCFGLPVVSASGRALGTRGPSALDLFDLSTGKSLLSPPPQESPLGGLRYLAVDPNGGRVASAAGDGTIWIWADGAGRQLPDLGLRSARLYFLSNGRIFIVALSTDAKGNRVVHLDENATAIEKSNDVSHMNQHGMGFGVVAGDWFVAEETREDDYKRTVIDLTGRKKPRQLPDWKRPKDIRSLRSESVGGAAFTADLRRVFLSNRGGDDGEVHAWDVQRGKLLYRSHMRRNLGSADVLLTPDEKHIITASRDGAVLVLSTKNLKLEHELLGPKYIIGTAISPDGKLVVATSSDGLLFVWRIVDGTLVATVDFSAAFEVPYSAAFSPDGRTLWVGTSLGNLHRFFRTDPP